MAETNGNGYRNGEAAKNRQAIRIVYAVCALAVAFLLTIGIALGGAYYIANGARVDANTAIKHSQMNQQALTVREAESGVRQSIPICQAIVAMDGAADGASNASKDPNSYGHRLAKTITSLDHKSGCAELIKLVKNGLTINQIYHLEQAAQKSGHPLR